MFVIFDILITVFHVLLEAVSLAMLVRMLLPLFMGMDEEGPLDVFLAFVTEPFIVPVRYLLVKFNLLQDTPIDWAFMIAYVIIGVLGAALPTVV